MLELSRQEYRDQKLVDSTLNENNGQESKGGMRCVPAFQVPLRIKGRL
jgi:hypothetical protein